MFSQTVIGANGKRDVYRRVELDANLDSDYPSIGVRRGNNLRRRCDKDRLSRFEGKTRRAIKNSFQFRGDKLCACIKKIRTGENLFDNGLEMGQGMLCKHNAAYPPVGATQP